MDPDRPTTPLRERVRQGYQGPPFAAVAYFGPDDQRAGLVSVGIVTGEIPDPDFVRHWTSRDIDLRSHASIDDEILTFIEKHGVKTVVLLDDIRGCPHEEGVDYPKGEACPECPFWANRENKSAPSPR